MIYLINFIATFYFKLIEAGMQTAEVQSFVEKLDIYIISSGLVRSDFPLTEKWVLIHACV